MHVFLAKCNMGILSIDSFKTSKITGIQQLVLLKIFKICYLITLHIILLIYIILFSYKRCLIGHPNYNITTPLLRRNQLPLHKLVMTVDDVLHWKLKWSIFSKKLFLVFEKISFRNIRECLIVPIKNSVE